MRRWLLRAALLLVAVGAGPVQAAVTITFWSRDFGNTFPHAFFMLRGTPDAGGTPVDAAYGFTAKSLTPAILFGNVAGRVERPKPFYINGSHVRFSRTLTDAQYGAILSLVREWHEETGDATYNLNKRNCVTFVREAARRAGLTIVDFPKLMKKPTGYLRAVAGAQPQAVTIIDKTGKEYLPTLPPLSGAVPIEAPVAAPADRPGKRR
ncbi:hypothetical protein J2Y58_002717 [Sphingomonas sp. BE138]|uniref:hypothetical protein n=1 Tax=Sphingomonas sp. BE138 TaxID=2817845 RepID=UPI00285C00A6|nr:hypothetical protein [Sphingomonas sp. BE138]MDR6789346.1 hypothetical protein [Sphingomonas sp. BE138]